MDNLSIFAVINYTRGGEELGDQGSAFPADRIPPVNGKIWAWSTFVNEDWRIEPYLSVCKPAGPIESA